VDSRRILHLDMDAFFASVEIRDDPSLAGKPVIIGNNPRGVVSAASYEARKYGVRSAMPVMRAKKLCPHGVFLSGHGRRYGEVSREIMAVVHDFSPLVEQTSVDEAYVDLTGLARLHGTPLAIARAMKARIRQETGLTASVGIAPNKYLAKVASDLDKPDGIYIVDPEMVEAFLSTLAIDKVPGIGPKTQAMLARYQVRFAGDIRRFPLEFWKERFGEKGGEFLWRRGCGVSDSPVCPDFEPKSSGAENTFEADVSDPEVLKAWLLHQAERVGRDLRKDGYFGRTVTLKVKSADFTVKTRSLSLPEPVCDTQSLFEAAARLLAAMALPAKVRLIGLSVSNFSRGSRQLSLFEEPGGGRRQRLDSTLDAILDRFGKSAVIRGRLFDFASKRGQGR